MPGMNTAQTCTRIREYVSRSHPKAAIIWVRIKNAWNWSEEDLVAANWRGKIHALALHPRALPIDLHEDAQPAERGGHQEAGLRICLGEKADVEPRAPRAPRDWVAWANG